MGAGDQTLEALARWQVGNIDQVPVLGAVDLPTKAREDIRSVRSPMPSEDGDRAFSVRSAGSAMSRSSASSTPKTCGVARLGGVQGPFLGSTPINYETAVPPE